MLIAQFSDTHVVALPGQDQVAGVDTAQALVDALDTLDTLDRRPDALLITGDLVNTAQPQEYAALAAILARTDIPLYLVPGNHDAAAPLRRAFPEHDYLQPDGTEATDDAIQFSIAIGHIQLIALDTTIPGRHDARLCDNRLRWAEAALERAQDRPVLLALHHPPFLTGHTAFDRLPFEGKDKLEALVLRYPNIERVTCGHIHAAIQRRFGGTIASVCPSPAFTYGLVLQPKGRFTTSAEAPGFQLHQWSQEGGLVTHTRLLKPRLSAPQTIA